MWGFICPIRKYVIWIIFAKAISIMDIAMLIVKLNMVHTLRVWLAMINNVLLVSYWTVKVNEKLHDKKPYRMLVCQYISHKNPTNM
jgi:hypothetical protein